MPEKECPTRTVGPSCRASTCWADATASGSVVRGFCTAVALSPAACNREITSDQLDPSANSPCTRTTLRASVGAGFAAMPRLEISDAAAPAAMAVEKVRLLIIMICLPSIAGSGKIRSMRVQRWCTECRPVELAVSFTAFQSCRCNPLAQTVDTVERIDRVAVDAGERCSCHLGERVARAEIKELLRAGFDEGLQRGGPIDGIGDPSRQGGGRCRCPEDAGAVVACQ